MDGVADTIRSKHTALEAVLDERSRRLWAAAEARALGRGGGRKRLSDHDPGLVTALELHLEPATRGDPERPLRWTSLSARRLADALSAEVQNPATLDQDSGDT